MNLFGRTYTNEDLLRHCNTDVLYGARRFELSGGAAHGQRFVEAKTAAGLRASFAEDKCLDILDLEYKGVNLAFLSKNGHMAASLANAETGSFTRYWSGGFLATCGLRNTGGPCEIDGESFPIHGHIGQAAAKNVSIGVNESEITIAGEMRETALFGHCLKMERKITIPSGGAKITVKDTVTNLTPEAEAVLLVYHINFGFPFLSEELSLEFPPGDVKGRTELAQERIGEKKKITPPIDGEPELVFFYSPKEKDVNVRLQNKQAGIKAVINYDRTNLPVLAQWKCMKSGDYALGIEPGTSFIRGRKEELEDGYDVIIPAFEKLEFGFSLALEDIYSGFS